MDDKASKAPRRLGRGLASLISTELTQPPAPAQPTAPPDSGLRSAPPPAPRQITPVIPDASSALSAPATQPTGVRLAQIAVASIRTNPLQPRKTFDETRLAELAESLKKRGALQPIVVRPSEGGYELVAGERRLRASKLAGLKEIPAVIRVVADDQLLELALIENVQRADLNAVERARAYKLLADKYGLTHEQVAERMGEDRATVSNYIRLLGLGDDLLEYLADGRLSNGHAKALLSIQDVQNRKLLAIKAAEEGWSVRRLEFEATKARQPDAFKPQETKRPVVADLEERLKASLGARVSIKEGRKKHTGRLVLEYYSLDDFERIMNRLGVDVEGV